MVVMATGRGKSIVFYVHAIKIAIKEKAKSLFIYPLRALISDQAHAIRSTFEQFGLCAEVLNGEVDQKERERIYRALADDKCDVILTTPEFLEIHLDTLSPYRFDFLVIDEAHHVGMATTDSRPAYKKLKQAISSLGFPTVLAASATLNDDLAQSIIDQCPIESFVFDTSNRSNLHLIDMRNTKDRYEKLIDLVSSGEKTIIYVNSRLSTIQIANLLRHKLPQLALMVGFYNAGLKNQEKKRIEALFREGKIKILVATSAFGEGVNIPDVRNVVLFHMPFSEVEFNQTSGRAGRDGDNSRVYLLFGDKDARINQQILEEACPKYDTMVHVHQTCQVLCYSYPSQSVSRITYEDLAKNTSIRGWLVSESIIRNALHVFNDLGFINLKEEKLQDGKSNRVSFSVNNTEGKTSLTNSVRYKEASLEIEEFKLFRDSIMQLSKAQLEKKITNPILPYRLAENVRLSSS